MTFYDFVVTQRETTRDGLTVYVEKVAVLDDDVTLDKFLRDKGVNDRTIGQTIERLEDLPYGEAEVMIAGLNGDILVKQR